MGRIVIPRPRRSTQRFYRPGAKLDPSMKGKFGAAELQFLTKAIDTAIAVGGKVIGAVERSQMDKGITGDAVKAAALQAEPSGLGGQKAMDAVSRAKADAAAGLAAGTLAPGPATYAMEQEASLASAPVATEEVVAVQEVGRPIVAVGDAPERAAYPEGHPTRWPSEITRSGGRPIGPGHPLRWPSEPYRRGGQTLQGPASRQMGPLADALGRAQALEAQAKESGNPDYLSEAWSVYDDISSGRHGALTDEQRSALIASPLINSAPFRAAFVGELPEVGGATAPTAAVPMAQPTARAAPQPRTMMSAEEALFRQRRQLDERERQRAAAFLPQNLRRMRPGQLQAILRFAKTPQEAAAVMGAIRGAPEVQPMGLGDVLGGGHITRAQDRAIRGWKPPSAKAPPSEFDQAMDLQRHNAWLKWKESQATANQALTDQRNAAIKAAQDKASAKLKKLAARVRGAGSAGKKNAALLDSVDYYVNNYAKRRAGQISDADWERGAGGFSDVEGPAGLTLRAERLGMKRKIVSRVGQTVDDLRQKELPAPPKDRRLLSDAQEGIQRREFDKAQKQIGRLTADIEIAQARMANQGEFPLNLPEEDTGYPPTTPELLTESLIMWAKERDSKQALLDKIGERLGAHEAAVMGAQEASIPTYVPGTPSAPIKLKSSGSR